MRFLSEKQRRKGKIYTFECRVQRKTRKDKIAFFGDQYKETEENNRMGKTRYLFQKIRDTKGTFHAKMGSIKDRNGRDLQKQKILRKGGRIHRKTYKNYVSWSSS